MLNRIFPAERSKSGETSVDMLGKRGKKDDSESLGIKKSFKPVESSPLSTGRPSPIAESGDTESTCSTTSSSVVEYLSCTICSEMD